MPPCLGRPRAPGPSAGHLERLRGLGYRSDVRLLERLVLRARYARCRAPPPGTHRRHPEGSTPTELDREDGLEPRIRRHGVRPADALPPRSRAAHTRRAWLWEAAADPHVQSERGVPGCNQEVAVRGHTDAGRHPRLARDRHHATELRTSSAFRFGSRQTATGASERSLPKTRLSPMPLQPPQPTQSCSPR